MIVVGAGHAGCEAALAAARMGCKTLLLTMNIFTVAQMSCNPAIGGLAKGQLVREIDALGGEMAKAIDDTGIQFRMLNRSKGPAVWSPRAQADRMAYSMRMRWALERQEGLNLKQGTVVEVVVKEGRAVGVKTQIEGFIPARAVVLTPGTFLNGLIHIGLKSFSAGRAGEFPAQGLTENLVAMGFKTGRLKTGTPPRVDGRTLDFDQMEPQWGDDPPTPFSFFTERITIDQLPCYLTYTNPRTHQILENGLDRSPLYTGKIIGIGPRYCPSIETKIVRFRDKQRHQIFLEPEGRNTLEYYVNGFATSLPEDVQIAGLRSIRGLERVEVTRLGYAIEYDFFPPHQLKASLETKLVENLFFAGQINGTSGYEEAAAQGIMAGINAVLRIRGEEPFVLDRSEAYIGVLIDDLITKDHQEPYRMFTSRAEYRLILRQDNADLRLMGYGRKYGLVSDEAYQKLERKRRAIRETIDLLKRTRVGPERLNPLLRRLGSSELPQAETLYKVLKRPEVNLSHLREIVDIPTLLDQGVGEQVEIEVKYEGYIRRQEEQIRRFKRLEEKRIPQEMDYSSLKALSAEAREKLSLIRPASLGQASRIAGVSPADISILAVYLAREVPRETSTRETG